MALTSGGGAATLRLMSLRLPCSEGKGGDGRCGAGTEWLRRRGGGVWGEAGALFPAVRNQAARALV